MLMPGVSELRAALSRASSIVWRSAQVELPLMMQRWLAILLLLVVPTSFAAGLAEGEGAIRFDVHYGRQGFKVGEARHQWRITNERYELQLELEATGLASLFGLHYEQHSRGQIVASGLQPEHFVIEQRGRKGERAEFDWGAAQVALYRDSRLRRSEALAVGDQDVLSLWHQARLHARAGTGARITFNVITGKRVKPATLNVEASEVLQLPVGRFETLRLRARAEDGGLEIELWLSPAHDFLPLRIRLTNESGEVLDQRAAEIVPEPSAAGRPARTSPPESRSAPVFPSEASAVSERGENDDE